MNIQGQEARKAANKDRFYGWPNVELFHLDAAVVGFFYTTIHARSRSSFAVFGQMRLCKLATLPVSVVGVIVRVFFTDTFANYLYSWIRKSTRVEHQWSVSIFCFIFFFFARNQIERWDKNWIKIDWDFVHQHFLCKNQSS